MAERIKLKSYIVFSIVYRAMSERVKLAYYIAFSIFSGAMAERVKLESYIVFSMSLFQVEWVRLESYLAFPLLQEPMAERLNLESYIVFPLVSGAMAERVKLKSYIVFPPVTGAMAERVKLESYIVFSMLNTLVYCIPAHWVWDARGWLSRLGMVDIAGAGAVHLVGGVTGLVATVMLKPRHHRYNPKAPKLIMGSPTNALLGLFMLW